MVPYRVSIMQLVTVVLPNHKATSGGLLIGHRNAAKIRRPAGTVAGVESVIHLTGEIVEAKLIKVTRIIASEQL